MKTADSIEQQEERKANRKRGRPPKQPVEGIQVACENSTVSAFDRKKWANTVLKPWHFKPGESGNPGGRPKHDLAAALARAVFENNGPALYAAFTKALKRGNAYAFKELADRAYGKMKEVHQVDVHPYHDLSEEELRERVRQLEQELGVPQRVLPPADDTKPN